MLYVKLTMEQSAKLLIPQSTTAQGKINEGYTNNKQKTHQKPVSKTNIKRHC